MPDDDNRINQEAEGIGIAQAAGTGARAYSKTVFNIPIEKFLIAELATSLVIQSLIIFGSLVSPYAMMFVGFYGACCFPVIFGPNAIYGLFMGYQLGNNKILILGLISGFFTLIPIPLMLFGYSIGLFLKSYGLQF